MASAAARLGSPRRVTAACLQGRPRSITASASGINRNYGNLWSYNQIPYDLRSRYDFDQSSRYYYRDGYVYRVNPRTMLVQQVVSALLR